MLFESQNQLLFWMHVLGLQKLIGQLDDKGLFRQVVNRIMQGETMTVGHHVIVTIERDAFDH